MHPFLLYQRPPTCFTARQVGNEGHTHMYIYTPLYVHEYMEILWHVEWNIVCIAPYRSKFCMWLHFSVAALHYLQTFWIPMFLSFHCHQRFEPLATSQKRSAKSVVPNGLNPPLTFFSRSTKSDQSWNSKCESLLGGSKNSPAHSI